MGEYVYLIADQSSDVDDETKSQLLPRSEPPPSSEPRNTVAAIITLIVFAIIIAAILAASVAGIDDQSHSSPVKSLCGEVTQQHTDYSCFNHTLHVALKEVENIYSSLLKTTLIIPRSPSGLQISFVMISCVTLFDDAVYQLSRSVETMKVMSNVVLTKEEMADMKTWVFAAMTDQETCVNGLEEIMGSTNVDEVNVKMMIKRSSDLLSNCLAILDDMDKLLGKLGSSVFATRKNI